MARSDSELPLPRLLFVSNFRSSAGGNQSVTENLSERLREASRSQICVSSYRSGLMRGADMCVTTLFHRRKYDLAVVDLYSGMAFLWGEALSILLSVLRRPFVLVLHGGGLPEFAKSHPKRVEACLKRASAVAAPSPFLLEKMQCYRSDIFLIPNALDLSAYEYQIRKSPQPNLIWLRSFHEIYNPSQGPRVVSLLMKDFPKITLTMVGPDKGDGSFQHAQQVVADLKISDRITFPGMVPQEQVGVWMNKGDVFLNTTNTDNTPVSVLQAMACGLCVVSTNVGGIPYLLEHEVNALLVPPNDPVAMANAVRRIVTEPGLGERLSAKAREKAEQFDWLRILQLWKSLLITVSEGHDR